MLILSIQSLAKPNRNPTLQDHILTKRSDTHGSTSNRPPRSDRGGHCNVCGADIAPNNPFRTFPEAGDLFGSEVTQTACGVCMITADATIEELEKWYNAQALHVHQIRENERETEQARKMTEANRRRQRNSGFTGIAYFDDPEGLNQREDPMAEPPIEQIMTRQNSLQRDHNASTRRRANRDRQT